MSVQLLWVLRGQGYTAQKDMLQYLRATQSVDEPCELLGKWLR
jgi:hypothetical protein